MPRPVVPILATPFADSRAGGFQLVHLLDQRLRRKDHAVADVAVDALPEDARGNQVQNGFLAADHQGMPGVVPALEAHHALGMVGEPVHHLALALVAPLGADDDHVLGHGAGAYRSAPAATATASLRSSRRGRLGVPMTTTFLATVSALAQIAHGPLSGAFYELALAFGSIALRRVSRKRGHDNLARGSQLADRRGEERVVGARRPNGGRLRFVRRNPREIAQVHAESRRGPSAPEFLSDLVVTPAERDRVGHA